jgi:hypothetical protein
VIHAEHVSRASIIVALLRRLRPGSVRATNPAGPRGCSPEATTVLLPMMSRRLSVSSPILDVAPSFRLPPVDL